ncbi:MAG TPA: glucosidase [Agriterribacter sp.]|nr:glucosidase [Agriterribacter sp.]
MNAEQNRLAQPGWKKWGPYLSERQWGTVREDYSADAEPWLSTTHDMARSKAWRWGEDGLGGICDDRQLLCFAPAFWNGEDPILKERLFGLSGFEGNHGEDVKELYYYLDATPTHSYMKMLYKYPHAAFPYERLLQENKNRNRLQPEFELMDTGIFDNDAYFDIFIEYAKADKEDILIRLTMCNRSQQAATLHVLPTLWFRNTWSWGYHNDKPEISVGANNVLDVHHSQLKNFHVYYRDADEILFCENETNSKKLYGYDNGTVFPKDGINDYIIHKANTVNPASIGTRAAIHYERAIAGNQSHTIQLRLCGTKKGDPFGDFTDLFQQRLEEADLFYKNIQKNIPADDEKNIQRQALAGMLWSKQFYHYDVEEWLKGDPAGPAPPSQRLDGRNSQWKHLKNENIISMPDKWEYPWYAAWDLAFHCVSFCLVDTAFAKKQLLLLTHEWYMHPNGELPAYEWAFGDANPPVHAWAAYKVYEVDKNTNNGKGDTAFLETVFHKLMLNFTWWVNRKDETGNNIFEGGFLGMDNIGVFNRNQKLPGGTSLEQSDGTSWMAAYCLNLMRIALELAETNPVYQDMATKFFEHFMYIAGSMSVMGENEGGLWDDEDEFYYDALKIPVGHQFKLRVRSMVGLIPLFVVEVLYDTLLQKLPKFTRRLNWFLEDRPELASLVSRWHEKGSNDMHLFSLLRGHRMKKILYRMLDEAEFLSPYGVRSLSRYHEQHPYTFQSGEENYSIQYAPAESPVPLFGGNSNWRGPIWMPVNYLIIQSLKRFHTYYGDDFKIEYPTHSGEYLNLLEISERLGGRLKKLFLRDEHGKRPIYGDNNKLQTDPHFNQYILFHEYFNGNNGQGLGASHQTGWTGLIARLL